MLSPKLYGLSILSALDGNFCRSLLVFMRYQAERCKSGLGVRHLYLGQIAARATKAG